MNDRLIRLVAPALGENFCGALKAEKPADDGAWVSSLEDRVSGSIHHRLVGTAGQHSNEWFEFFAGEILFVGFVSFGGVELELLFVEAVLFANLDQKELFY